MAKQGVHNLQLLYMQQMYRVVNTVIVSIVLASFNTLESYTEKEVQRNMQK